MVRRNLYITLYLMLLIAISGCSTVKNTWYTRTHHSISTRFNVFFNGKVSYDEGLANLLKSNVDDYSNVIPMYPISKHSNAIVAVASMDRTIEKCRKSIKLYSIKKKPQKNLKQWKNPEYQLYYNQSEFNPALRDAWLSLAKAEFHKGDFLGSVGTFSYIARFYGSDKDAVATSQLWLVRAYAEMGWIYEAEQMLSKVNQDNLKRTNTGLFAAVNADLLLKKQLYKDAIPFLELTLSKEKNKAMKLRFGFLLAQLYQKTGDYKSAFASYTEVIKKNPPFEMDFNARINRAQLNTGNIAATRKELLKMISNLKNKEYLDQLYFALGNTYLQRQDTVKAIENYKLSSEKSTRKALDKAITLITLGDIYYGKRKYVLAQPCYDEAGNIITKEHNEYLRVTKRAETLGELVLQNDIVVLQDSLQQLAGLPESKRLEIVEKLIAKLIADEKEAEAKEQAEALALSNASIDDSGGMEPIGMNPIGSRNGEWYFYNPQLVKSGIVAFGKLWGKRKLEDNWRRKVKASALFVDENSAIAPIVSTDSLKDSTQAVAEISDVKNPAFYLQQIPVTKAQRAKSDEQIATALFAMGMIYKDKVEDFYQAVLTFEDFIRRFPSDERVAEAYFNIYLLQTRLQNKEAATKSKSTILAEFPNSKYVDILLKADSPERIGKMYEGQDSIYELTYKAYLKSEFQTVKTNVSQVITDFPLSTLMPKFLFLKALSVGKTESPESFGICLEELIKKFPESDVTALAKDMMAMIKQGEKSVQGKSQGTLLARRNEVQQADSTEITAPQNFSKEKFSRHRILLLGNLDKDKANNLLFEVASFNFNRFLIKDFDLTFYKLDSVRSGLNVSNLESYEEAIWYLNSLETDSLLAGLLNELSIQKVIISDQNFGLLRTVFSLEEYLEFEKSYLKVQPIIAPEKSSIGKQKLSLKSDKPSSSVLSEQASNSKSVPMAKTTSDEVEEGVLFKSLFIYKSKEPHIIAISIPAGGVDFEKIKFDFENFNKQHFGTQNLKMVVERIGKQELTKVSGFVDANAAKTYYSKLKEQKDLMSGFKNVDYKILIGSQKNLNILMQQNAMAVYLEFMKVYYFK